MSVERRTVVDGCWPHLLEMLLAMGAATDAEAAAIWDDAEAWARGRGYITPLAWQAEQDVLEDLPDDTLIDLSNARAAERRAQMRLVNERGGGM